MEQNQQPQVHVDRPVYDLERLHKTIEYTGQTKHNVFRDVAKSIRPKKCLLGAIPVLEWLPKYNPKTDLLGDLIAGFTVAVMHIPQGMAYGILGNVDPVVGLYMAFFPTLVYFFFGTSRHVSMGTFAVICLMTGKAVTTYSTPHHDDALGHGANSTSYDGLETVYTPIEVGVAVTIMTGLFQLIMYVFRLGVLSSLLSSTLVNGFTTGAAIHVVISQLKDLFGLKVTRYTGVFKNIYTIIDIINALPAMNLTALLMSSVAIVVLIINNEVLKKWVAKKSSMPIPIELIAVLVATLISRYANLSENYGITTVGKIPTGMPDITLPNLELMSKVAVDSLSITVVSYSISLSMAMIFAQKLGYEVSANQELLAQGLANVVGSFFSCLPFCASLSRSLIQQTVGGKTQLASVISCGLILTVILWIGPFFEPLPRCILASIIVVALKGMLVQCFDLARFWSLSKLDALVWMSTFLATVFLDIDIGLLVGVALSLVILFLRMVTPRTSTLGLVNNTDIYLDAEQYSTVQEVCGLKIIRYCGGLNFASKNYFRNIVYKLSGLHPQKELALKSKGKIEQNGVYNYGLDTSEETKVEGAIQKQSVGLHHVILDFSSLMYIDPEGVQSLRLLVDEYYKVNVSVYVAACSNSVYEMIRKCDKVDEKKSIMIFPTLQDAVTCATAYNIVKEKEENSNETVHL